MGKLDGLIPIIYKALDKVNRGTPGMLNSVFHDGSAKSVAINEEIRFPVTGSKKARDVVPGSTVPSYEGDAVGYRTLKITKQRATDKKWTGNELVEMASLKPDILADEFQQMFETLMAEMELDMCYTAVAGGLEGGHVIGEAGTAPFQNNLNDLTLAYKTLMDAKAPLNNLKMVLNSEAGMNLRNQPQLQKLNESGGSLLRKSEIGSLFNFDISETNGILKHEKGAGSGYLINASAGIPVGSKELIVDTGSGIIKQGDIITIAGDDTKYVVAEEVKSGGTIIKLVNPLKKQANNDSAITVGDSYSPNVAFDKDALWIATRTIPNPDGGDVAEDIQIVTDPVSGMSFMVSYYKEYHQVRIEVAIAWGTGIVKPNNIVTLLG